MSDVHPLDKLKAILRNKEETFKVENHTDVVDSFFPYIFHGNGDPPIWQRAKIIYMPRRPSLLGEIIWIQIGTATIRNTKNIETGRSTDQDEAFITNLNGPDEVEDAISLRINQLERMSGPDDFSWEDVKRIKYDDWYTETITLTDEEEEGIKQHLLELDAWYEESYAIYDEWLASKSRDIALGLMDETGKILVK